eukprot:CAMPEP_0172478886 /NCGR_PEP_ID=MMETSP1066-20121228/3124_1 /TAXON_ID=671091 /ORGANISM="Coscinodiscus wailesii, Strain CCMP2513" /LENGTH=42 /DNA_ID= /DNA_START= /DNA_END= /DNA_ORIENTATION=
MNEGRQRMMAACDDNKRRTIAMNKNNDDEGQQRMTAGRDDNE